MATEVKCPSCGHGFPIEEVMAEEYKQQLRLKMQDYTRQKEEEFQKKAGGVYSTAKNSNKRLLSSALPAKRRLCS
jgi:uncharacterized Zn finger protein (UPF0148 family)